MSKCATPEEVQFFCESISDETTKNLDTLRSIETTVFWLSVIQKHANANFGLAIKVAEDLKIRGRVAPIDVEDKLSGTIETVESRLNDIYNLLISMRDTDLEAAELDGPDKVLIVDEYTSAITAVADLHNAMTDLRWAVMEHDADLEKDTGKTFTDVNEMFADMGL